MIWIKSKIFHQKQCLPVMTGNVRDLSTEWVGAEMSTTKMSIPKMSISKMSTPTMSTPRVDQEGFSGVAQKPLWVRNRSFPRDTPWRSFNCFLWVNILEFQVFLLKSGQNEPKPYPKYFIQSLLCVFIFKNNLFSTPWYLNVWLILWSLGAQGTMSRMCHWFAPSEGWYCDLV